MREMEADDLIRPIILNPAELEQIIHGVPDALRGTAALDLGAPVLEWIRDAQARGDIVEGDPEVVVWMLGLVKFLPTHQDDIDPALYPRLLEMAMNVVADGLTTPRPPIAQAARKPAGAPRKRVAKNPPALAARERRKPGKVRV